MKRPYQDVWKDGKLAVRGARDCAGRYKLIASTLPDRPLTVLDVGAYTGYFSTRIAEDFDAQVTAVDDFSGLVAAESERVKVINQRLGVDGLLHLPRFDVVLALSVLHHMKDWRNALELLRCCRSHLVIEVCHPQETWMRRAASRAEVAAQYKAVSRLPGAKLLGTAPRIEAGNTFQRPVYLVPGSVRTYEGMAFTGSGWCHRNMSLYDQALGAKLGYEPFPGSLNVRLSEKYVLGKPWLDWEGSKRGGKKLDRQFWRAWIGDLYCHAHVPGRRNHGPNVIELVAPVKLRDRFAISDGDTVTFDVEVRP